MERVGRDRGKEEDGDRSGRNHLLLDVMAKLKFVAETLGSRFPGIVRHCIQLNTFS